LTAEGQLVFGLEALDQPGVLFNVTRVIFDHGANVGYIGMTERAEDTVRLFFELDGVRDPGALVSAIEALDQVVRLQHEPSFQKVFGRRIIVIGGGAQVSSVVMGAVSEADRHNIRGERISVDTIPLVGESEIAEAVRATARLPRVEAVVLAGSLMGGDITEAVVEVRRKGIMVVSLKMAGSVPDVADLVVGDPVQAGVMTVMLVASTARLDIDRIRGRSF
jgi:energy-converting hydrogenase B subunit Q